MPPALILASQSPRRKQLLQSARIPFRTKPSGVHEPRPGSSRPHEYAKRLALKKALFIAKQHPDDWVLGADTIVVCKGKIIGKPTDTAHAKLLLKTLQGTTHRVITGVALVHARSRTQKVRHATSRVTMRSLSEKEMDQLSKKHLDKAGSYAVQEQKDPVVIRIEGSYTNVVGLPMELTQKLLNALPTR